MDRKLTQNQRSETIRHLNDRHRETKWMLDQLQAYREDQENRVKTEQTKAGDSDVEMTETPDQGELQKLHTFVASL